MFPCLSIWSQTVQNIVGSSTKSLKRFQQGIDSILCNVILIVIRNLRKNFARFHVCQAIGIRIFNIFVYILLTKREVKMAGYWRSSLFASFRDFVSVHKIAKRERGQYPAILTELAWSIKDLLHGIKSTEKMIFVLVYFHAQMESSYMLK